MTGKVREILSSIDREPRAELALRLILLALLLAPVGKQWARPMIMLLAATGLLLAPLQRSALWLGALLALAAWRVVSAYPLGDNHSYLLAYWLLALLLASRARDRDAVLAWNARVMIGLVFAFATLWKLWLSPDYLDGRFFLVSLLDDRRLEDFARLAGGLDLEQLHALRALVSEHQDGVRVALPDDPLPPARLVLVARMLTFSLLALEASVALSFLAPLRSWISRVRDLTLIAFCAGVYAVAPVAGFGWLLISMGIAQCEPQRVWTRRLYLAAYAWVLLVSRWPWLTALAG